MIEVPMIEWRALAFATDYDVGDVGLVRSAGHRILEPRLVGKHLYVDLERKGHFKAYQVARLVALAFHGDRPSAQHMLAFLDFDRSNVRADNLAWVLTKSWPKHVKLTPAMRAEIRASSETTAELARRFHVVESTIIHLRKRQTWATDGEAA